MNSSNKDNDDSFEEENQKTDKPSYTYWKRETDKPFSNDFKPQKSETIITENTNQSLGSAWNKAGTWEEKHLPKSQLEEIANTVIANAKRDFNGCFIVDRIKEYSGDTYYVFIRGKIKFVYDCEITLYVVGINDFESVAGDLKIKEVNNHTLDDDFEFDHSTSKFEGGEEVNQLRQVVKGAEKDIQNYIRYVFDQIKETCLKNNK